MRRRGSTQPTELQRAFADFVAVVERLERLNGRDRAVALDLAQRRLAQALAKNLALLEEWDLAA